LSMRLLSSSSEARSAKSPIAVLRTLERAREALLDRSVLEIVEVIGRVANRFLDPKASIRELALQGLPDEAGISAPMAEAIVDGMAREWTTRSLLKMLHTEFEEAAVLDTFTQRRNGGKHRAVGLSPAVHITSGNVPGVGVTSLIRGLMVKSAVLLKPGAEDRLLSSLFLDALASEDHEIAAAAAVVEWDVEDPEVIQVLNEAELVVVYGGADAVDWVRRHMSPSAQSVVYPHRVSAAVVMAGYRGEALGEAAAAVAASVAMFDQRGCVSPHTVFVVTDDPAVAERFANSVAEELETLESSLPAGLPQAGEASAFHQAAGSIELESQSGAGPVVYGMGKRWRVVYEPREGFRGSCLGRFVWIRPVPTAAHVVRELEPVKREIQTLGVWGKVGAETLEHLARLGVRRITTIQRAPWPAARSRHDGLAPLRSLLRWVEVDG